MSKIITQGTIAKYIFDDSDEISVESGRIVTPDFIIGDLNSGNSTLYTGVTDVPEDFTGDKYLFDGEEFDPNPAYVELEG